jgi:hypothetical protein
MSDGGHGEGGVFHQRLAPFPTQWGELLNNEILMKHEIYMEVVMSK